MPVEEFPLPLAISLTSNAIVLIGGYLAVRYQILLNHKQTLRKYRMDLYPKLIRVLQRGFRGDPDAPAELTVLLDEVEICGSREVVEACYSISEVIRGPEGNKSAAYELPYKDLLLALRQDVIGGKVQPVKWPLFGKSFFSN